MKVFPAAGLDVRDPVKGDFLPAEGRTVESSPYWLRRLRDKDVSLTRPGTAPAEPVADPIAGGGVDPVEWVADTLASPADDSDVNEGGNE